MQAVRGAGRFQWDLGGWFGATVGSTAWMLVVVGFLLHFRQFMLLLVPLAAFLLVLTTSIVLWNRRDRVRPFVGYLLLLVELAIAIPVVWVVVSNLASAEALEAMQWPTGGWYVVFASILTPVVIVWFTLLEVRARSKRRMNHSV